MEIQTDSALGQSSPSTGINYHTKALSLAILTSTIKLHEDNNKEELNHTEVGRYMKKNRGEGRMTGEIGQRMRLRKPLGDWNILANKSETLWPLYYLDKTDILYKSYGKKWHKNGEFYYDCHTITGNNTYK